MFRILSVTCLITRIALRLIIHVRLRMSVCNFVVASALRTRSAVVDDIRCRIVGVMFPPSKIDD